MDIETRRLWAVLDARDAAIAGLRRSLAESEADCREKQHQIGVLLEAALAARDAAAAAQADQQAKQAVIQDLKAAVDAYRAAFLLWGPMLRIIVFLGRPVSFGWRGLRKLVAPRIGTLHQHPPRQLDIPAPPRVTLPPDPPSISIVTPSFRQARYIERTIRSVLDQGYPALEYFVQDGGSEDGTVGILERYATRLAGWESRKDSGQSQAINRGFARTGGDIMAWLNSDDVLMPGALACIADHFARHPEVDVVYGHRVLIDEEDRQVGLWIMPEHDERVLSWADYVPQETLFWRRSAWERAGGKIDERFNFAMDWDLLLRLRDAGARFHRLPIVIGGFRVHSEQKTSAAISAVGFAEMDQLRARVLGRVPTRAEVAKALAPYLARHIAAHAAWRSRALVRSRRRAG